MLGKSLKYEFKSTMRIFLPLYAAIVAAAVMSRLSSLLLPNLDIFTGAASILYIFILIGTIVLTLVIMIQRFYKCVLGDEGYLTMTLPVKIHTHILTKGIAAATWLIGTVLVAFLSIFIFMEDYSFLKDLPAIFESINKSISQTFSISFAALIALMIAFLFVGAIAQILMIYTAMSVGQLASKNRLLLSFASYVVIDIVIQSVVMVPSVLLLVGNHRSLFDSSLNFNAMNVNSNIAAVEVGGFVVSIFTLVTIVNAVLAVVFFFATRYLLKNKLNLE